jgi:prolyl-tRNA editing enzyme YbaK/EbsC (Cys-tRNA(Pro) deacylase)
VLELPADASTAQLAALALNTGVNTIVKSLVFLADEAPALVLAAGDRKVSNRLLAQLLGAPRVKLAKPDEVTRLAGYPVGGVPPVAHRRPIRTFVDRNLLDHPIVYAAAGAGNAVFAVTPARLIELTEGEVADLAE